jgi:hypothetical protein
MKFWREYMCDGNHRWEFYSDHADSMVEESICAVDGLPAVIARKLLPADRVAVALVPAARIVDGVTGRIGHDDEYLIEIRSVLGEGASRRSSRTFKWDDAVTRAAMFRKSSWEQALGRWTRMSMDRPSGPRRQ